MVNRNASASAFGWDFQANAALVLMLDNIENAESIRVEGNEDIEIFLNDQRKIYAQAKSVMKADDYSNVNRNLIGALETLNDDSREEDGDRFTYVTNSPNPFNNQTTMSYFYGNTHLLYDELPDVARRKIVDLITKNSFTKIDLEKFDVRIIPFIGEDLKNRYKCILESVDYFLHKIDVAEAGVNIEILERWQQDFFHNATLPDTEIAISKEQMIWPLIVIVVNRVSAREYKSDYDDDEAEELEQKYKALINFYSMRYEMIAKVVNSYVESGEGRTKKFVERHWREYMDIVEGIDTDSDSRESLIKIILYRILTQKDQINKIKKGVHL